MCNPYDRVHHPRINAAVEAVLAAIRALQVVPYNEGSAKGELRYLQLTAVGNQPGAQVAQHDPLAAVQVRSLCPCLGMPNHGLVPRQTTDCVQ